VFMVPENHCYHMAEETHPDDIDIGLGTTVYDDEGRELGTVRGLAEDGIFVTFREGMERFSQEHTHSSGLLGEAQLMWRCTNCGEMGDIEEGLPDTCPNCGHPKEELEYWKED